MTTRNDDAPLTLLDLCKTMADGRRLLDIAELRIGAGECLLLSGRNGAGKTTLLKVIAGLETPDTARVSYAGRTSDWHRMRAQVLPDVVYLHQHPYLFDATVADNVAYGLRCTGLGRAQIAKCVEQALEWAGLRHLAQRHARRLSGGEQHRVAIARAWVLRPRFLLLDEPLANLDHEARERTYFLIQHLKSQRAGIVLTSHEPQHLSALADRHLVLEDGCLHERPVAFVGPVPQQDDAPHARNALLTGH